METEIIKTDNPNILIERTVIDREINIGDLITEKEFRIAHSRQIQDKLNRLLLLDVPEEFNSIKENQILEFQEMLTYDSNIINNINIWLSL